MKNCFLSLFVFFIVLCSRLAHAQETRRASEHFQRGVALYGETDYRGALVEFKRAYSIAPNAGVLYNVGQTQYQLQDYAAALTTFERFLVETGPGDGRRAEVESDLEVLRARVGRLAVATTPGAEVTIDDQPAGRAPLERSLLVSIGHRKIVVSAPGRPPVTRYADVAAGDEVSVAVEVPDPSATAPPRAETNSHPSEAPSPPRASQGGGSLRVLGWIATGTLAAGATCFGILALRESRDLEAMRATYPASPQSLSHDSSLTTTYSMVADALAAGALVIGGATLLSTLLSGPAKPATQGTLGPTRLVLGPTSAHLFVTF
jgi:hypothetical protein